jgi:hypothetical protein
MKRVVPALLVLALAAGCGSSSASKQTYPTRSLNVLGTLPASAIGKARLARLAQQALSRRRWLIPAGTTRTFHPTVRGLGDLVICRIRGHDFQVLVPDRLGAVASIGWRSLDLTATRHRDGSVTATCHGTP